MSALVAFPRRARRGRYHDGTIVALADGRYRVQVSAGTDPATGKRVRLGGYASSKPEAEKLKHRLVGQAQSLTAALPTKANVGSWTLGAWLDQWYSRTTLNLNSRGFRRSKAQHIKDHLGRVKLQELRKNDVWKLVNETLAKEHCGKAALSPQSRDHVLDVLRAALNMAVNEDEPLIGRNVAKSVVVLGYDPDAFDPTLLSEAEYPRFLSAAAAYDAQRLAAANGQRVVVPMEAAFVLLAERGLREGELLGLQREDLDLSGVGTIRIRQQLQPQRGGGPTKGEPRRDGLNLKLVPTKSKASRRKIRLTTTCKVALRKHIAALDALEAKLGPDWNPDQMLFPTVNGIPMHPTTVANDFFRPICVLADVHARSPRHPGGLTLHSLRHTSATNMLRKFGKIDEVRQVHGWSSLKMVQRYVHLLAIEETLDEEVVG